MKKFKGACFCQSVQFELDLKNFDLTVCHCSMCRKLNGSTGFASLEAGETVPFTSTEGLSILHSSDIRERGFCSKCGLVCSINLSRQMNTLYHHQSLLIYQKKKSILLKKYFTIINRVIMHFQMIQ